MEFVFDTDNSEEETVDTFNFDDAFAQSDEDLIKPTRRNSRRTLPSNFSDIEFNEPTKKPRKRTTGPKVSYVKSVAKTKRKTTGKMNWTWGKFCWALCGVLVLRLFLMESGVVDYNSMNNTLIKKENNLQLLRRENVDLIKEIHKIKTSPSYQKKLAREHLGVIAHDEYLVLFSKDSSLSSSL